MNLGLGVPGGGCADCRLCVRHALGCNARARGHAWHPVCVLAPSDVKRCIAGALFFQKRGVWGAFQVVDWSMMVKTTTKLFNVTLRFGITFCPQHSEKKILRGSHIQGGTRITRQRDLRERPPGDRISRSEYARDYPRLNDHQSIFNERSLRLRCSDYYSISHIIYTEASACGEMPKGSNEPIRSVRIHTRVIFGRGLRVEGVARERRPCYFTTDARS